MHSKTRKTIEKILLWLIIFLGGFFMILVFLQRDTRTQYTAEEMAQLLEDVAHYHHGISPFWLQRHGLTITSEEELLLDHDNDGLTLAQEYHYRTDPFNADSDYDGYSDGREVENGYRPNGAGRMEEGDYGTVSDDAEEVPENASALPDSADTDGDELSNALERYYGTDPHTADTDGDGFDDGEEVRNAFDPAAPGAARPRVEVHISKIGVSSVVVLSESEEEESLRADLEQGVIRYPGTAAPGQPGNIMITGHSSNYMWSRGAYNNIFKDLGDLAAGDEFSIVVKQHNGVVLTYVYRVAATDIVAPDDPQIFAQTAKPRATLVTCWPLYTSLRRLIVQADLVSQTEGA